MPNIFVKTSPTSAHRELLVSLDWTGVSQEEVKFLAQQQLLLNLKTKILRGAFSGSPFPSELTIVVKDELFYDKTGEVNVKDYKLPPSKAARELENALAGMSKEEILAMLTEA